MYIKVTNNQAEQYSIAKLKQDNPSTSFPAQVSAELLAEYGVYECTRLPVPEFDGLTHKADPASQPVEVNGAWIWEWDIIELDASTKADNIRRQRNSLLGDTDWWAVQDRTMSQDEVNYRQALRDIPDQPTFPDSVVWPTKPE
jgi:hypothetical protein